MQRVTSDRSVPRPLTALLASASTVALALTAHAAGAGGPLEDAKGDAVDVTDQGALLIDLASTDVRYDADTLYFELSFFTEITAPSAQQPNGLGGLLEFDIDQDFETGIRAAQNRWSPPFAFVTAGGEYALLLASEWAHPGLVELRGLDGSVEMIPVTYTSHSVSGSFPLAYFVDGDGVLNFSSTIGDPIGPTDAVDALGTSCRVCPGDIDASGMVDFGDILAILAAWGPCEDACPEDLDDSGAVDFGDILVVLAAWGPCD